MKMRGEKRRTYEKTRREAPFVTRELLNENTLTQQINPLRNLSTKAFTIYKNIRREAPYVIRQLLNENTSTPHINQLHCTSTQAFSFLWKCKARNAVRIKNHKSAVKARLQASAYRLWAFKAFSSRNHNNQWSKHDCKKAPIDFEHSAHLAVKIAPINSQS